MNRRVAEGAGGMFQIPREPVTRNAASPGSSVVAASEARP